MKNLEMLGAKLLNKSEMSNIKGGLVQEYTCACNNGSAAWIGTYGSDSRARDRAAYWCGESGGYCNHSSGGNGQPV